MHILCTHTHTHTTHRPIYIYILLYCHLHLFCIFFLTFLCVSVCVCILRFLHHWWHMIPTVPTLHSSLNGASQRASLGLNGGLGHCFSQLHWALLVAVAPFLQATPS